MKRELSDEAAMHQAEQFIAYASKSGGLDAFDRWAASKDLGRADQRAISERVAYLLMRGDCRV